MTDVLFDITFLYAFDFLLGFIPTRQAIHFGSETNKFVGWDGAGLTFHFSQDAVVLFGVQGMVGFEVLVSNMSIASPMSW